MPEDVEGSTIRRKYLHPLAGHTGRSTIRYATAWMNGGGLPETNINLQDMQGMMEVCRQLPGPNLDLILHSPGGTAEAAASIVTYLRQKYDDIRVFVPLAAMSAATTWAMSANRIVMDKHSQLGPIELADARTGKNGCHALVGMVRQSVCGRLAGYEDVNDAEHLRYAPYLR